MLASPARCGDARALNGALGFGFQERITADLIKEMCDFYRSQSTPIGILQLAPAGLPDNQADICAEMNLSAGSTWLKLARDLNARAPASRWPS